LQSKSELAPVFLFLSGREGAEIYAVAHPDVRLDGSDRTYVSRLERGLENPTVAILEQLANALNANIVEFFVVPAPDEPPPKPLRGGRRPKR